MNINDIHRINCFVDNARASLASDGYSNLCFFITKSQRDTDVVKYIKDTYKDDEIVFIDDGLLKMESDSINIFVMPSRNKPIKIVFDNFSHAGVTYEDKTGRYMNRTYCDNTIGASCYHTYGSVVNLENNS